MKSLGQEYTGPVAGPNVAFEVAFETPRSKHSPDSLNEPVPLLEDEISQTREAEQKSEIDSIKTESDKNDQTVIEVIEHTEPVQAVKSPEPIVESITSSIKSESSKSQVEDDRTKENVEIATEEAESIKSEKIGRSEELKSETIEAELVCEESPKSVEITEDVKSMEIEEQTQLNNETSKSIEFEDSKPEISQVEEEPVPEENPISVEISADPTNVVEDDNSNKTTETTEIVVTLGEMKSGKSEIVAESQKSFLEEILDAKSTTSNPPKSAENSKLDEPVPLLEGEVSQTEKVQQDSKANSIKSEEKSVEIEAEPKSVSNQVIELEHRPSLSDASMSELAPLHDSITSPLIQPQPGLHILRFSKNSFLR